jgi:hypothetical protein
LRAVLARIDWRVKLTLYVGSLLFVLLQASELSLETIGIQPTSTPNPNRTDPK